ncbi:hypothetical protein HDU97_008683 [Phlyctochytrium planicorne]|nr:hypothetical protein HDU97_008683 [Phlyctochytrium planicorne]
MGPAYVHTPAIIESAQAGELQIYFGYQTSDGSAWDSNLGKNWRFNEPFEKLYPQMITGTAIMAFAIIILSRLAVLASAEVQSCSATLSFSNVGLEPKTGSFLTTSANSACECALRCLGDDRCVMFSYVGSILNYCHLYAPSIIENTDIFTVFVADAFSPQEVIRGSFAQSGSQIEIVDSVAACRSTCLNKPQPCDFYQYSVPSSGRVVCTLGYGQHLQADIIAAIVRGPRRNPTSAQPPNPPTSAPQPQPPQVTDTVPGNPSVTDPNQQNPVGSDSTIASATTTLVEERTILTATNGSVLTVDVTRTVAATATSNGANVIPRTSDPASSVSSSSSSSSSSFPILAVIVPVVLVVVIGIIVAVAIFARRRKSGRESKERNQVFSSPASQAYSPPTVPLSHLETPQYSERAFPSPTAPSSPDTKLPHNYSPSPVTITTLPVRVQASALPDKSPELFSNLSKTPENSTFNSNSYSSEKPPLIALPATMPQNTITPSVFPQDLKAPVRTANSGFESSDSQPNTQNASPTVFPADIKAPIRASSSGTVQVYRSEKEAQAYNSAISPGVPTSTTLLRRPDGTVVHVPGMQMAQIAGWNVEQVATALTGVGVALTFVEKFRENNITGYMLLLITDQRLKEMGVDLQASRNMILYAIDCITGRVNPDAAGGSTSTGSGHVGSSASNVPAEPPRYE